VVAETELPHPAPSELDDWIHDEERRFRARLRAVDLTVRADFDESEIHRIQGFYGIAARRHRSAGGVIRDFIGEFPALTLTALVGHAALAYDHGRYWDTFWAELGLPRTLAFENALRESVIPAIARFDLDRFPDLRGRYVSILSVHAGIPIHCLGALVDVAAEYLHRGRSASGAGLAEWISRSETNPQIMRLAKPVRYFIRHGGSFAIDVLDRMIGELRGCSYGDVHDVSDRSAGSIPRIISDGIHAALQVRAQGAGRRSAQTAFRRRVAPSIAYAVLDDQIVVDLPATESEDRESWRVSVDGDTRVVIPDSAWGLAWHERPPTRFPVSKPAREVLVEQHSAQSSWTMRLIDAADPVLIFDSNGRWLRRKASLPKGEVVVVYPVHARLVDDVAGVELEPYIQFGAPGGWHGWQAAAVDLSDALSFRVVTDARKGTLRGVRVVESPRLVRDDVLTGLTTPTGIQAYGKRPQLVIPGRAEGEDSVWFVRVHRADGTPVSSGTYGSESQPRIVDPFEDCRSPIAGVCDIAVTGAAGSSLHFTSCVLEGVGVELDSWVRVPLSGGGLSPATVHISSEMGISCSTPDLTFSSDEIRRPVELFDRGVVHRLVLTYPHVRFHVGAKGEPIRWRTSPMVLLQQDLDETPDLVLSVPGCNALRLELVDVGGRRLKWTCPKNTPDGHFTTDLRAFADVARVARECRLTAVAVSEEQELARFQIALVRPAGTCHEVRLDDGYLVFEGLRIVDNLSAYIWWISAPWATPLEISVTETRMALPKECIKAGDLYVQLFVADPWAHCEAPAWPNGTAFRVEQPGYRRDRHNGRERLSKYLVNGGHAPTSEATMPEIWAVLARTLDDDVENVRAAQMRRDLLHVVSANPRTALETLGNSTILVTQLPSLVVWTELASKSFRADFTLNELHANPWVGCMVEIADLPSLFARRTEVRSERAETLSYLEEQGGDALIRLLATGATTETARPESEIVTDLIELGDEALEHLATELRSVPSALFSAESRWSAFLEAFDSRDRFGGNGFMRGVAAEALHLASTIDQASPMLAKAIAQRQAVFDAVGTNAEWAAIPLFTLVLAGWARLEAHDALGDSIPPGLIEQWAKVAECCPSLVFSDLLHAEATVTFERYGDLISDLS